MSAHTPRVFEVPAALVAAGYGPTVDLDVLDRAVEFPGEFGDWAEKVLYRENAKILHDVCGDARLAPRGILSSVQLDDGSVLVSGLVNSDGRVWDSQFNAWGTPSTDVDVVDDTIILDEDEIAFVARALREGADEVWFRPYIPKAFVPAIVAAPAPPFDRQGKKAKQPEDPPDPMDVPAGSAIVAVVDPIDEDAVLELLAITPGPRVLRRHDAQWFDDPEWVPVLKSVRPPKIVRLNDAQVASVTAQVDRSTNNQDWEPFESDSREQYQIFTASAVSDLDLELPELQDEELEETVQSLIAVAGRELTPEDVKNTERLKRYWTIGEGAAKIRWGTPGAWTRCFRNVSKYMPPHVAKGYCTNLSQRLGGPGIATHVGDVSPLSSSSAIERSPYLQELQNEADERALFALVAVAGRELSPKDIKNTEQLKRYWTIGEGAAKIRWGTPGSWRRCYHHLVKYVGPRIAPGYCTNLSKRLGGPGIATHVGDAKPIPGSGQSWQEEAWDHYQAMTAANPEGINAYDKGKTFEQATGGVKRDYHGRFAPEGGSGRSTRSERRAETVSKSSGKWDESAAKFEIIDEDAEAEDKKRKKEREKAQREAQQEELAQISLEISEAVAAGDTVKAAQLRVKRAERALAFADTNIEKLRAQTALNNAKAALARARRSASKATTSRTSTESAERRLQVDKVVADFYNAKGRYPTEAELKDLGY